MIYSIVIFVISLIVLVKASHTVLKSIINLSKYLGLGEFAIAFILVSIATSLPELFISIMSGLQGNTGLILGNVIGSNIANKSLVLGSVAVLTGITITRKGLEENAGVLFLISLLSLLLLNFKSIGLIEGIILILVFLIYSFFISKSNLTLPIPKPVSRNETFVSIFIKKLEWFSHVGADFFLFVLGMFFVIVSSHFMVKEASTIALVFGFSETVIGLTIVALGTSLPELAIAITSILKKHSSIAFGEVFGSSVVNLTLVLGTGAIISPIIINFSELVFPITLMISISLFIWFLLSAFREINKKAGILMLLTYILYLLIVLKII